MNRSSSSYWLGLCILTAAGILSLAVFFSRSRAQDQVPGVEQTIQNVDAPSATLFSYQGHLLDNGGAPVTDSAVDMTFKFFSVPSGGTACWTENHTEANAINVQNGYFNVLLGQLTAINTSCLSGDVYLELDVNGETLSPRELLTSVAHAVEASGLSAGASAAGELTMNGSLDMNSNSITNLAAGVYADSSANQIYFANDYGTTRMRSSSNIQLFIDSDNDTTNATFKVYKDSKALNGAFDQIMALTESGDLFLDGSLIAEGSGRTYIQSNQDVNSSGFGALRVGTGSSWTAIDSDEIASYGSNLYLQSSGATGDVIVGTDLKVDNEATIVGSLNIDNQGSIADKVDSGGQGPHVVFDTDDCFVFQNSSGMRLRLCGDSNGVVYNGNTWHYFNDTIVPTVDRNYDLGSSDRRWRTAYLESASCGAIVEANLQTEAEKAAEEIDRFAKGDVLCWGDEQLEKCSSANDRLIMSVADAKGKPIVMGAEAIKVLGPIKRGDILVSSEVPGFAMVNNDPIPGTVIAQALEDYEGESGLVKAMIRKW